MAKGQEMLGRDAAEVTPSVRCWQVLRVGSELALIRRLWRKTSIATSHEEADAA